MSKILQKAQEYEISSLKNETEQQKRLRPRFHFSTPVGWCNDPNGFSYYNGKIHLFFQYHPYSTQWGPMHWGHVSTTDLINWKNEKTALAPDTPADESGCFSGTALEKNARHLLVYTGVSKQNGIDIQNQCIAWGDGETYEKSAKNPVITAKNIPFEYTTTDFRDPKIFEKNGNLYMLCALKQKDGKGCLVMFKSSDSLAEKWEFIATIDKSKDGLSGMWECPDYFTLQDTEFLIISPQEMKANPKLGFHDGNNSVYITGKLDFDKGIFTRTVRPENNYTAAQIDYGIDFYAPETIQLSDGRRILIGWMQAWESYITPKKNLWSGMMTIPRELSINSGRLVQNPVKELNSLRKNPQNFTIPSNTKGTISSQDNRHFDFEIEFSAQKGIFSLHLAEEKRSENSCPSYIEIKYDAEKKELSFDRSHTQNAGAISSRSVIIEPNANGNIKFRLIADTCSVEIFANNGLTAFTNAFFVPPENTGLYYESTLNGEIKCQFFTLGTN